MVKCHYLFTTKNSYKENKGIVHKKIMSNESHFDKKQFIQHCSSKAEMALLTIKEYQILWNPISIKNSGINDKRLVIYSVYKVVVDKRGNKTLNK